MKWIKTHYMLFGTWAVLLLTRRWGDLKDLHRLMKDPKNLKIEEVDFEFMTDTEEELWR